MEINIKSIDNNEAEKKHLVLNKKRNETLDQIIGRAIKYSFGKNCELRRYLNHSTDTFGYKGVVMDGDMSVTGILIITINM